MGNPLSGAGLAGRGGAHFEALPEQLVNEIAQRSTVCARFLNGRLGDIRVEGYGFSGGRFHGGVY